MIRAAFDLDGTLVDHEKDNRPVAPLYADAKSIRATTRGHTGALARVRRLMRNGVDVHIVTGRGRHLRAVTLQQVRRLLADDFPAENLHTQEAFTGYDAMRVWKAATLRRLQPVFYVGDHPTDKFAATDAMVPFIWHTSWRVGHALPFEFRNLEADVVA